MSNTLVNNDFVNPNDNKKYVVKVEDPVSGTSYFSEEVTIPRSGVYKLVLRKTRNVARERSNSLSGNNLGLPANPGYRNRSPSLSGNNLGLPRGGRKNRKTLRQK